jgi:hypothetical protein
MYRYTAWVHRDRFLAFEGEGMTWMRQPILAKHTGAYQTDWETVLEREIHAELLCRDRKAPTLTQRTSVHYKSRTAKPESKPAFEVLEVGSQSSEVSE